VLRGSRAVDVVASGLVAVNGVLSVTDQMNPADWAALIWNAVIFALLVQSMRAGLGSAVQSEENGVLVEGSGYKESGGEEEAPSG
jgi:hypothetical protein